MAFQRQRSEEMEGSVSKRGKEKNHIRGELRMFCQEKPKWKNISKHDGYCLWWGEGTDVSSRCPQGRQRRRTMTVRDKLLSSPCCKQSSQCGALSEDSFSCCLHSPPQGRTNCTLMI